MASKRTTRRKARRGDYVVVIWEDAYHERLDRPYDPCITETTGVLVNADARHVRVAQNKYTSVNDCTGHMVIPTSLVRGVRVLERGEAA